MDYQALLQEILTTESYLCLATSTALGQPWATPLCFISDEKYRLYFISQNESLHALHIAANPHVAFSIFNTRQPIGNAF
jgi:general stress protein 26